jgi:hypothetical protein
MQISECLHDVNLSYICVELTLLAVDCLISLLVKRWNDYYFIYGVENINKLTNSLVLSAHEVE